MEARSLYREQQFLAGKAVFYDAFGKVRRIAGLDCAYFDDKVAGGIVALDLDTLEPVEKAHCIRKVDFPYVPGLLAYREAKAMVCAFGKLKTDVDVLMIDGFGTNHPRRCGLATHLGVKLDMPSIGVGKSFLCGEIRDDNYIYQDGERVGKLVYAAGSKKPVYVSAGHRISLETAVELVERCQRSGRVPEPVRQAHIYVSEIRC